MTTKTNKELLESCKTHLEYGIDDIVTPIMDDFQELFTRFEKQIPKKPIGDLHSCPHYRCPVCHGGVKMYDDSPVYDFCHHCGQMLDWSDV